MSSQSDVFDEKFYRDVWDNLQDPKKQHAVEVLKGENQLDEEDFLERVDLSEDLFYDIVEELENEGVIDHYDREHSRGPQKVHMSLYRAVYPAKTALEFDDRECYIDHMLEEESELIERYQR